MLNYKTDLLSHYLAARADEAAEAPGNPAPWDAAIKAVGSVRGSDPELDAALAAKDLPALRAMLEGWKSGERRLPEHDRDLLKRALRAFRKRLGSTRLDDESTIGGSAMSGGRSSDISGVSPPSIYPKAIWQELVHRGRLRSIGHGIYEIPAGS